MDGNQIIIRAAIAERLSMLRHSRGMSMVAFAALLGVSRPTAYAIMSGKRSLDVEQLILLAHAFNVELDFLLGTTPPRQTNDHSQVEAMIAHELIKLLPGSLDRVLQLIPGLREQYYGSDRVRTRSRDADVLATLRRTVNQSEYPAAAA